MKRLRIKEFTTSAEGRCLCCTKTEAAMFFLENGATGKTDLCCVKDGDKSFILWINCDGKKLFFLPLFIDDVALPDLYHAKITPLTDTEFIYHRRNEEAGMAYLAIARNGEILVRQIKVFIDQNMVEKYCISQNIKPSNIYLCKMYTVQDNRYLAPCWLINYENPEELDDNGDPIQYERFFPVDLADSDILFDYDIVSTNCVYMHDGDTFESQGVIYRAVKDQDGKFYLTKDLFSKPKNEKTPPNEAPTGSGCKIIPLRKR